MSLELTTRVPTDDPMSEPLTVTIPHRLGKAEAIRRMKGGLSRTQSSFGNVFTIEREQWDNDRLNLQMRGLGQVASGVIEFGEAELRLTVTLPWLLSKLAGTIMPALRREATLLLEKK